MRFVIINVLPRAMGDAIEAIRRPLNRAVGSREALRYPVHLTLRTGLVCPDNQALSVSRAFLDHAAHYRAFELTTGGLFFTTYGTPGQEKGMVGWSVAPSDALMTLHRGLLDYTAWAKGPQSSYQPHVTLAFDDLTPQGVEDIRTRLADQTVPEYTWRVDHVALYHEFPDGWVEWDRVSLS